MTYTCNTRLSQFLSEELRYLLLKFDDHNQLVSFEGNAAFYNFDMDASPGKNAEELLPFLTGADITVAQYLPYIEFIENIITDIYLYPNSSGFEVVLLETSKQHNTQQTVQQQSNENAILHYRLQQLDEKLKQNNVLLEKANKAQSEFIATASHELKTPLSSILGYAELLKQHKGNAESDQAVTAIFTNGNYLLSLIDNLLEQGRVEGGQVAIQRRPCKVSTLLTDIENIIQPLARKKQLSFKVENGNDEIVLNIDEQHVRQVLINLLTNAIKFTINGSVSLKIDYSNKLLQFNVIDTGIGIPETELAEIMLPFRRSGHHSNSIEGIGLGLSVSKKLATLMDGDLIIESTHGQGTNVIFSISADRVAHGETDLPETNNEMHVLLVEDDKDLSLLFENILTTHGFHVETVSDKKNLDRVMSTHQPEVILMDHNVNGYNGLDLIHHISQRDYAGKIIMMTASSEQSLVDLAMEAGCCDFLQKPVSRNRLIETIQAYLK